MPIIHFTFIPIRRSSPSIHSATNLPAALMLAARTFASLALWQKKATIRNRTRFERSVRDRTRSFCQLTRHRKTYLDITPMSDRRDLRDPCAFGRRKTWWLGPQSARSAGQHFKQRSAIVVSSSDSQFGCLVFNVYRRTSNRNCNLGFLFHFPQCYRLQRGQLKYKAD